MGSASNQFMSRVSISGFLFFFNDTATTEIYTLSLHDALPICLGDGGDAFGQTLPFGQRDGGVAGVGPGRSEEHTSELQSHSDLVCRLLLEKKKTINSRHPGLGQTYKNLAHADPVTDTGT